MYVDNAGMQLVREPKQFDVIVTGNMFGDILSDVAAMLTGSLGMLPSASLARDRLRPVRAGARTAPGHRRAGQGQPAGDDPVVAMMCRYSLDMPGAADAVESAVAAVLAEGFRTADIYTGSGELVDTQNMGELVLARLEV